MSTTETLSNGKVITKLIMKGDRTIPSVEDFGGKYHINTPEEQCGVDGKYWYDNACHNDPQPIISFDGSNSGNYDAQTDYDVLMNNGVLWSNAEQDNAVYCYYVNSGNSKGLTFTLTQECQITMTCSYHVDNPRFHNGSSAHGSVFHSYVGQALNNTPQLVGVNFPAGTYFVSTNGNLLITELTAVPV